jgi:hypothetical protein
VWQRQISHIEVSRRPTGDQVVYGGLFFFRLQAFGDAEDRLLLPTRSVRHFSCSFSPVLRKAAQRITKEKRLIDPVNYSELGQPHASSVWHMLISLVLSEG